MQCVNAINAQLFMEGESDEPSSYKNLCSVHQFKPWMQIHTTYLNLEDLPPPPPKSGSVQSIVKLVLEKGEQ